ncbi:copper chaperone PCu(A)C [Parasphingorhabdus sp.]|jgi:copper(I)-binding protein|uniref:copper chaperone PCu(A)C n=1 Tax=Parasphingorhabdus sp. TaxID=2709688 RepID=UPI0007F38FC1|nr:hypothetical protein A8B75_14305 [Sphingomonadales bacterium EhC05]
MKLPSFVIAALAALILTACGQGDILNAKNAVVNLSPVEGNPSAGYMNLTGGPVDVELVGVTSDDVLRMEMHETVEENGMSMMNKLKSISVPSGKTVKLQPGGKHLMIWGIGEGAKKRGLLTMTLIYSNDDRIKIDAVIKKMGAAE